MSKMNWFQMWKLSSILIGNIWWRCMQIKLNWIEFKLNWKEMGYKLEFVPNLQIGICMKFVLICYSYCLSN
jgi:hypothetical protein